LVFIDPVLNCDGTMRLDVTETGTEFYHVDDQFDPQYVRRDILTMVPGGYQTVPVWTSPDLTNAWNEYIYRRLDADVAFERYNAKIQGIVEPLKVRVISKGEAAPYYASRGLQKALHGALRQQPCFRLIGRPLDATAVTDIYRDGDTWLSADYKAATDNLSASLSEMILDEMTAGYPEDLRTVWKKVLAPHSISYPRFDGKPKIPDVDQTNGQLMGSILSFPVLCLANLILFLWFESKCGRKATLGAANRSVLINGDDLLARVNVAEFPIYQDLAKRIGLPLSVGKTYTHPVVLNVNSTCYHANARGVTRVDYLNTGLLFGQGKVMSTEEGETRSVSATFNEVVKGALPGRQCEIAAKFIAQNSEAILRETTVRGFVRNLFLPEALGGVGQTPPLGFRVRFTSDQKRVAYHLYNENRFMWVHGGVPVTPVYHEMTVPKSPWELAKIAEQLRPRMARKGRLGVRKFIGAKFYDSTVPRWFLPGEDVGYYRRLHLLAAEHGQKGLVPESVCVYDEEPLRGTPFQDLATDLEEAISGDHELIVSLGMSRYENPLL